MKIKAETGDSADAALELLGRLAESGGTLAGGLVSNPWVGIPLFLMVLAQVDPSGKLTQRFLGHFATFLEAIGGMLGNAILNGLSGVATDLGALFNPFAGLAPQDTANGKYGIMFSFIDSGVPGPQGQPTGHHVFYWWANIADRDAAFNKWNNNFVYQQQLAPGEIKMEQIDRTLPVNPTWITITHTPYSGTGDLPHQIGQQPPAPNHSVLAGGITDLVAAGATLGQLAPNGGADIMQDPATKLYYIVSNY